MKKIIAKMKIGILMNIPIVMSSNINAPPKKRKRKENKTKIPESKLIIVYIPKVLNQSFSLKGNFSISSILVLMISIFYTSKLALFALLLINLLLGGTSSPISISKVSSAISASSMVTCFNALVSGFIVVSQS